MKLTIVLGASSEASFDINLYDNSLTRKWVKELSWCLESCDFNQLEAFATLLDDKTSEEILRNACHVINKYVPNFIDVHDDILSQSQEYFNYLHLKFEKLSGSFESPTRLMSIASDELKTAIRNLNFFTHRIEVRRPSTPALYISFDKNTYRRKPLEESDYQFFAFSVPPGTLFLHYVELGKEFIDLYEDNLPLDYSNCRNLHFYSGEASLTFEGIDPFKDKKYVEWLVTHGIDPYNKMLGHGRIPLGVIDDIETTKRMIVDYPYLNRILIEE